MTAGRRLCPLCREQLSLDLRRLPALYEACGRLLDGGFRDATRPKTSGGPPHGVPFNTLAADVRADILGVLGSWAGAVVGERGGPAPCRAVPQLSVFLGRHLDWIAAHDAAGECSGELARLVGRARRVVDPDVRHRVTIGGCVEPGCAGALTAVVRPDPARLPAVIRCDRDPAHHWPGHQWLHLRRRLDGAAPALPGPAPAVSPGRPAGPEAAGSTAPEPRAAGASPATPAPAVRWVTAADVARLWGISTGSAYRHASEAGWRRHHRRGRTYYHGEDVLATLGGRRTGG
ncbi:hypothetical protein [Streptomyces similanensis]|uniref:hypothetical protein n=1 Tax=Streptomyces similanensis TaxID=1274988 RepID=UPI0031EDC672